MFTPEQAQYVRNLISERSEPVTESGCWIWTGSSPNGYGDFRAFGKKHFLAHRASYQVYKGEIPNGLHILHSCDVRACVNPSHLRPGTNVENILDSVAKGRRKGITRKRPSGLQYNCTVAGVENRRAGIKAYWAKWREERGK